MSLNFLHILHIVSAIFLVAVNFWAFASLKPEQKRPIMKWSGIASLGVFLSGFAMQGMLHLGFPGWLVIKILCWLLLSAVAGAAYRHPENIRVYIRATFVLVLTAVTMAYLRPF